MNTSIQEMLKLYEATDGEAKKNAMKEIMQEILLCGLSRAGFFNRAAFYGGTALRIFYGLDRFSEDMDFSLTEPDPAFDLSSYFPMLEKEVASYGLKMNISEKVKTKESTVRSAFLKGNTKEHLLLFWPDDRLAEYTADNEVIKIKFEVDIDPPQGAGIETRYQLLPSPYEVRLYDMPSLFAGKIHAVVCRGWKNRVKGRDLYDYVFYLSRGAKVNLSHLKARFVDTGLLDDNNPFDIEILRAMLYDRFDAIDYNSAKEDVRPFISDQTSLNIWSADFFKQITGRLHEE